LDKDRIMRKIALPLALAAGLFTSQAQADFTGKNAAGTTITFKNPVDCTSVVCAPMSSPYALAVTGTGWTSATGGNTTQTLMAAGYGAPAILVLLDQTTTLTGGAVTFEGSYDGTNFVSIPVAQIVNPQTLANLTNPYTLVASTRQPFMILTNGFRVIQLKLSTVITGSATVTPSTTLLPVLPVDPALLAPLAAGSAIIGKVGTDITTPGTSNQVALIDPCSFIAKSNFTGSQTASSQIIAGTSAKKTYICSMQLIAAAAEVVNIIAGTGSVCATGSSAVMGSTTAANGMSYAANGGFTYGSGVSTVIFASNAAADNICLTQSGSSRVTYQGTYVQN